MFRIWGLVSNIPSGITFWILLTRHPELVIPDFIYETKNAKFKLFQCPKHLPQPKLAGILVSTFFSSLLPAPALAAAIGVSAAAAASGDVATAVGAAASFSTVCCSYLCSY